MVTDGCSDAKSPVPSDDHNATLSSENHQHTSGVACLPVTDSQTYRTKPDALLLSDSMSAVADSDTPPNGGYGWIVVCCISATNAVTWGVNTVFGVYTSYFLEHNYFVGGSSTKYAWTGGSCAAIGLASSPLANWLSHRYGFRWPMGLGAICIVMGQIGAGLSSSFAAYLATQGVVFGLGLGLTLVPSQPLIRQWFGTRLGRAQGITNAGSGVGALILANTTRLALENLGVKWSLIINGLVSMVVLIPAIALLRSHQVQTTERLAVFRPELLWHHGFMWVWLWGAFAMMGYFIAIYSLASFATNGLHLSQTEGAALQSILAAGQLIGRPFWGVLLDKGGRINMSIICYIIAGLSCLAVWLPAQSMAPLAIFAVVQGFAGGTVWSAGPPVTASILPPALYADGLVLFWLACVPAALVAQPIAIAMRQYSEDRLHRVGAEAYYISIGFCGSLGMVSALLLLGAKRFAQGDWHVLGRV